MSWRIARQDGVSLQSGCVWDERLVLACRRPGLEGGKEALFGSLVASAFDEGNRIPTALIWIKFSDIWLGDRDVNRSVVWNLLENACHVSVHFLRSYALFS